MRQLLPVPAEPVDLVEAYAYPTDRAWVRANMVTSLDGSTAVHGRSGDLGGDADSAVFDVLRSLADVVLVGAGTARTEGYKAPRAKAGHAAVRSRLGLRPAPVLALVTRSLDLDPASAFFTGDERTVVVTPASGDEDARAELARVADVVIAGEADLDVADALDQLAARGLTRVLCEGGPGLLGSVLAAGRLDELCLTTSPLLVGGDGPRVVTGRELNVGLDLACLLESDGALLARYVVQGAA